MDTVTFPLTKIRPPRVRAPLIAREVLERRLGDGLSNRRLTLLVAPAGFGKTAALSRQLELMSAEVAAAWISADGDDDLHRFLACLFAALEPFDLPWRTAPEALMAAAVKAAAERRRAATELLNALMASNGNRGLIVVDDAHRITDQTVFEFLDLLLERLPEHWGIVIGSRVEPPLSLARLRAQDEVAELGPRTLRFGRDEVSALISTVGIDMDAGQLLERTGGWPAGLRLSLNVADHGHVPPAGVRRMDRHVFEYVSVEVLDKMTPELRDFLLRCSLLPELTAARCAAVSGNPRAAELLEEVDQRGLFVSVVDGPEPTLTLHDLFRDCLIEHVRRNDPEGMQALLRRAADTEPDPIRRFTFLQRAAAWDEAERLLETVAVELVAAGALETVFRLIEQFPRERRERSPMLALMRGQALWATWDWWGTAEAARRAREGFEQAGDAPRRRRAAVLEAIALLGNGLISESRAALDAIVVDGADLETRTQAQALRVWQAIDVGDFRAVAPGYMAVLDLLEQCDGLELWYRCFQRPLYVWLPGVGAPLQRFVDGVMRRNGDSPSQIRSIAYVMAAWAALLRGDLAQCSAKLTLAMEDARWLGMPTRLSFFVNTVGAALHAVEGNREAMTAAMNGLLVYFERAPLSGSPTQSTSMFAHYVFYALRLADTLGDGELVRAYAERLPPPDRIKNIAMLRAPLATVQARLAALEGDYEQACAVWESVLADESAIDVLGLAHEARVRYALALLARERVTDAAAVLVPVLRFGAQTGEIGGLLLAGRTVLTRLVQAPWRNALEESDRAVLLSALERLETAARVLTPNDAQGDGRLSPREVQVLKHIAAGDSNKLIARALELSPHTVKRHVANILDKLGLCSRGEAAQWYRSRQ